MTRNKILTSTNASLAVQFYGLLGADGLPLKHDILEGVPIGTSDGSSTGEVGVKVIVIGNPSDSNPSAQFTIPPYDEIDFTYYGSTNNIETQIFKKATNIVATLTFTYAGNGAANDDLVTKIAQS